MAVMRWVRRRVVRWSLAAALLVVLIWGRGLGVLHNGEGVMVAGATAGSPTAVPSLPEPPSAGTEVVASTQAPAGTAATAHAGSDPAERLSQGAAAAATVPPAAAPAAETAAADADRAGSLASAVVYALEQGQVVAASRALQHLREHAGEAGRRAAAELETKVQQLLAHQMQTLARAITEGEIGAAERQLQALTEPTPGHVAASLTVLARGRNWPSLTSSERADPSPAAAATLGGDRAVRWWDEAGTLVRSRVVRVDGDRATLRLVGERGVTFPAVQVYLLEPESPSAGEAAELGMAALAAGAVIRARLWCACALARGGGDRAELLRAALP